MHRGQRNLSGFVFKSAVFPRSQGSFSSFCRLGSVSFLLSSPFSFSLPPTPPHPTFPSPPSRPFLLSLLSLLSLHLSGELLAWEPHLCPVVSSGHLSVGSVRCLGPPLVTKQGLVVISSPSRPPPLPSRYVTAARSFRSGCLPRTHLFQVTESPRREF